MLSERDLELLRFAAEHRFVLVTQVQALLGVSADTALRRCRTLETAGYLADRSEYLDEPRCFRAKPKGVRAVGKTYGQAQVDSMFYRHNAGVGWMWLAAQRGAWGDYGELISERSLRAGGGLGGDPHEPAGVRMFTIGGGGRRAVHYPDMVLVTPSGKRVAFELELTGKSRRRLEGIVGGYATDRRIDAVVYLVEDPAVRRAVEREVRSWGAEDKLFVQDVRWAKGARPRDAGRERKRTPELRTREAAR